MEILEEKDGVDTELLVYAMTLINKVRHTHTHTHTHTRTRTSLMLKLSNLDGLYSV